MTGLCAPDLFHANMVAREMVLSAGMGRKMGELQGRQHHAISKHGAVCGSTGSISSSSGCRHASDCTKSQP
jgi:hypothetical protein